MAVCGCSLVREADGAYVIVQPAATCPHAHQGGEKGHPEGAPSRVTGVGECVTVVFERQSRTAMLLTPDEKR
ncbi:MAG: hypothetical protein ACXWP4_16770 [Polyangiales bacterium]